MTAPARFRKLDPFGVPYDEEIPDAMMIPQHDDPLAKAIAAMQPHERLFTQKAYGVKRLKPAPHHETLYIHMIAWFMRRHDDPACRAIVEATGSFSFVSPVRHGRDIINVGLSCPKCMEPVVHPHTGGVKVWMRITEISDMVPPIYVPNTSEKPL